MDATIFTRVADLDAPTAADLLTDEASCLEAALSDYSKDRPRRRAARCTASGLATAFDLTVLVTGWIEDSYKVKRVQYPLGEAGENRFVDENEWRVSPDLDNEHPTLYFDSAPGSDFGLHWIEPHQCTYTMSDDVVPVAEEVNTVPHKDKEMLAQRTAFHMSASVASRAAIFTEGSPLNGDSVSYSSISGNCRREAEACAAEYERLRLKDPVPTIPVFVESDIEINPIFGSYSRPARYR